MAYRRSMAERDNTELVALALAGGTEGRLAWNQLVTSNSRAVWKVLWALGLSKDDRDDVFQGTWLRAVERLHQLREPAKLHVWLMIIARHEAESILRRKARLVPTADLPEEWEIPTDAEGLERDERYRLARMALSRMTAECRSLVRLLTVEDLSYREIEEIMGWALGGTSIRRARCLEKIRETPEISRYLLELGREVNKGRGQ